jgi:predicted transcriptional regulator
METTGAGPISMRETARRVKRDGKAVRADVQALRKAGVSQKTVAGQIVFFPYEAVRLDVTLHAA